MTHRSLYLLIVSILAGIAVLVVSCSNAESKGCGNQAAIWFHKVVSDSPCADCRDFTFPSSIVNARSFLLRPNPDFVLSRCEVTAVRVHSDGVTLVLAPDARHRLSDAIDQWQQASEEQVVAVRLANASSLVSVMYVEDLGQYMTLFDFSTANGIDDFIADLGAASESTTRTGNELLDGSSFEDSQSAIAAREFLEDAKEEDILLDELEEKLESAGDEGAVDEFLRQIQKDETL